MERHHLLLLQTALLVAACLAASFTLRGDPPVEAASPAPYDWLQMNGDAQHSGNNTQETVLGPSNVANLKLFFQVSLPAAADGAPVALSSVATPSGTRNPSSPPRSRDTSSLSTQTPAPSSGPT
jgi:hypothetical protein